MSRCILFITAVILCITACENLDLTDPDENQEQTGNDNKPSGGEGEGETESVKFMTITVERVSATKVVFKGTTKKTAPDIEVGIYWSKVQDSHINDCEKVSTYKITNGSFELVIDDLDADTKYYCYPYLFMNGARELGDEFDFKTAQPKFTINNVLVDGPTVTFTGYADYGCSVGIYCSTTLPLGYNYKTHHQVDSEDNNYSFTLNLSTNTTYYYCTYVDEYANDNPEYGEVKSFTTENPTITTDKVNVSYNFVTFSGHVALDCNGGVLYSTTRDITFDNNTGMVDLSGKTENFIQTVSLKSNTTYYYCTYYYSNVSQSYVYGEVKSIKTEPFHWSSTKDLSSSGTANCYVVSKSGWYKIKAVKGNSSESVGAIEIADVLWESFGTDVAPSVGDLVQGVSYKDGYIGFKIHDDFKEGNALVAAKDEEGNILWSWHIWLTDEPQGQVYYNNAGTMMDRNLGATSAIPGDVGALGLLYQWGRKDPFLGSSSISSNTVAESTISWPSAVSSNSGNGTIEYATAHPTTFIIHNSNNDDWYYTGSSSTDNSRWQSSKTIYDPCPAGWRVPPSFDVWSSLSGHLDEYTQTWQNYTHTYDNSNEGMNFSGTLGGASTIWYPASGFRFNVVGGLYYVGNDGGYWSASPCGNRAYDLYFNCSGVVDSWARSVRAYGLSVRCLQE